MRDAPLVSAHAAGIPKPTHFSPPVPELMHQTHLFRSLLAIRYDSHFQTLMQLGRYTVRQSEAAPSPMQDARWLSLTVDISKMHMLAQIICQSKGQSSTAILR